MSAFRYKGALIVRNPGYCAGYSIHMNGEVFPALSLKLALDIINFLTE